MNKFQESEVSSVEEEKDSATGEDYYTWWDNTWQRGEGRISQYLADNGELNGEDNKIQAQNFFDFLESQPINLTDMNAIPGTVFFIFKLPAQRKVRVAYSARTTTQNLLNPTGTRRIFLLTGDVNNQKIPIPRSWIFHLPSSQK
jgi:hypothetical protein